MVEWFIKKFNGSEFAYVTKEKKNPFERSSRVASFNLPPPVIAVVDRRPFRRQDRLPYPPKSTGHEIEMKYVWTFQYDRRSFQFHTVIEFIFRFQTSIVSSNRLIFENNWRDGAIIKSIQRAKPYRLRLAYVRLMTKPTISAVSRPMELEIREVDGSMESTDSRCSIEF